MHYKNNNSSFVLNNLLLTVLMATMLFGVIVGAIFYQKLSFDGNKSLYFLGYDFVELRLNGDFLSVISNSIFSTAVIWVLTFALGFGSVSQPFEFLIPFFRGLGLGASAAHIYASYGKNGFLLTLVLFMPMAIVTSFVTLIATRESIRFSSVQSSNLFRSKNVDGMSDLTSLYCSKFMLLGIITVVGSFLECGLSHLISKIL